jgi:polyribonucleotide nucleotidyltransferase
MEAVDRIKAIVRDVEPGEKYTGRVVAIQPFGAFIELIPGKDGLLHISKMAKGRIAQVESVLNIGDEVEVVVQEIDDRGKVSLDLIEKFDVPEGAEAPAPRRDDRGPRGDDRGGRGDDRKPRRRN